MDMIRPTLTGFADDARKAIVENPDYFVRWYSAVEHDKKKVAHA